MKTDDEKRRDLWLHWARMSAWTHHEASALTAGIIPSEKWSRDGLRRRDFSFGEELDTRYFRIWDLLLREETIYKISFPIELPELLEWSERTQIDISEKFLIALYDLSRLPLAEQNLAKADAVGSAPSDQQGLGMRERDSLLKMVLGMAMEQYAHDPYAKRTETAGHIESDIASIGLTLDQDTIRKYLKEARERFLPTETA